ncbi:MAG: hypothetical protein JW782_00385 [Candidatus Saganbacteria bacterium]|nr:hypothetical protein [Candidatus Saganbacteria bacterium]
MGKILRYSIFYAMMFGALGGYKITTHLQNNQQRPAAVARADTNEHLTAEQAARLAQIDREIENIRFYVWHERDLNKGRIQIARLYIEQSYIDLANRQQYLRNATAELNSAGPDEHFRFHSDSQYVRDYFEVKFELANLHFAARDPASALAVYQSIIDELGNNDVRLAQQIHDYSVPGYSNRARLELAWVHIRTGDLRTARPLLEQVQSWASSEASSSDFTLYWRDENVKDLHFLEAKALLGLGAIAFQENDFTTATGHYAAVLSFDEAGQHEGFMDLGLEAILQTMHLCLQTSADLPEARDRLETALPWDRINQHQDLMSSLGFRSGVPHSDPAALWNGLIIGMRSATLTQEQQEELKALEILTEISLGSNIFK